MTEEQLYDEAFQQMGSAPLELDEAQPAGWGGARPGAGGLVRSVQLSKEDGRTLRTILLARYGKADKATANAWLAGVIRQEWEAYDAMIQEMAEESA